MDESNDREGRPARGAALTQRVTIHVSAETYAAALAAAGADGLSIAALARRALEDALRARALLPA